jgi:hypothetical protein
MKSENLASTFIRFAEAEKDSDVYEDSFWAYDELSSMGLDQPLEALSVILTVLSKNPSPKAIELLAAGPLEDLLVANGPLVIDEIERRAESDSNVAILLGGVWQSEIDIEVWKRVENVRSRKW